MQPMKCISENSNNFDIMKKNEENKSLSARIKRRNAGGFKGEGTPIQWTKRTPSGNWQEQPTRKADKAREIGKNANRPLHKHNLNLEFQQMLQKFDKSNGE